MHTQRGYGGERSETYNIVRVCKEEIQAGTSETSKLLLLTSLKIYQSR